MSGNGRFAFPPYVLDPVNQVILRGSEPISVRPKTFAIFRYLLENSPRIVSKKELLTVFWPHVKVSDASIKVSILEIRKILGDMTGHPKFMRRWVEKGIGFLHQSNSILRLT